MIHRHLKEIKTDRNSNHRNSYNEFRSREQRHSPENHVRDRTPSMIGEKTSSGIHKASSAFVNDVSKVSLPSTLLK